MARSRQFLRRPLLLFALLLLGPAIGFSLLGWDSVRQEHAFRLDESERTARDVKRVTKFERFPKQRPTHDRARNVLVV